MDPTKSGPRADQKAYLLELPVPPTSVLVRELGQLITVGLAYDEVAQRQRERGQLTNLLQLASVRAHAANERDAVQRLCQLVAEAADAIEAEDVRRSAVALVGQPGSRGGGIRRRRTAAAEAGDYEKVDSWERRLRPDILRTLAAGLERRERSFRESAAANAMQAGQQVPAQLAIDWLDRLERYHGMSEELDSLHTEIALHDRHRLEVTLPEAQLYSLQVSSLFRLAMFEYQFLKFYAERRGLWLFTDPAIGAEVDRDLWRLRILARFPEHVLAWLALSTEAEPFPNLFAFRSRIEREELGRKALGRWQDVFALCACQPPDDIDRRCPVHEIAACCERFVSVERRQREALLQWYGKTEASSLPDKNVDLADLQVRLRGTELSPRGYDGGDERHSDQADGDPH